MRGGCASFVFASTNKKKKLRRSLTWAATCIINVTFTADAAKRFSRCFNIETHVTTNNNTVITTNPNENRVKQ